MAIDFYEGIMDNLNVLSLLNMSNNDGMGNLQGVNPSLICMKSSFGIIFVSIATPMK